MRHTAVLFDLDGTLLDTLNDVGDSMNAVLARHGLATHPTDAYRWFIGDGVRNLVLRALPEARRSDQPFVDACLVEMRGEYSHRWKDKTRPYEGVPELLQALAGAGVTVAILSNKPHEAVTTVVGHFFPDIRFAVALGSRPGAPHKPDPAAALEVSRLLRRAPEEFLYLGDSGIDMETAVAAGMYAVGAAWGFRGAEELRASGAHVLVSRPAQVMDLM